MALRRRGGRRRLRTGVAPDHGGQPVSGRDGQGLLPPLRERVQPPAPRRGRRDQRRGAVHRGRGDRTGLAGRRPRTPLGQAGHGRRSGAVRALRGVSPRSPRTRSHRLRCRAQAGRDDALRDPALSAPAEDPRRGDRAHRRARCHDRARSQGHEHPRDDAGGRIRRSLPGGGCPPRQARVHPRRIGGPGARRRVAAPQHGGRGASPSRTPRRRLRRWEHRD